MRHHRAAVSRAIWPMSGAVWGPALFIVAWAIGGVLLQGYSPIEHQVSRLAAVDAPTAWLMNLGFIASALGAAVAAGPLRSIIGTPAAIALGVNGAATVGVLLNPVGSPPDVEIRHAAFAGVAYLSLSALGPLAAARSIRLRRVIPAAVSVGVGVVTFVTLAASLGDVATGLYQRIGLTATGVWLMVVAVSAMRGRLREASPAEPTPD